MKFGAVAVFILALLALAAHPAAQSTVSCSNISVNPNSIFNLAGISLLGLVVSIDVVAIGYIIGRIIPSSGIRSWISDEFLEIAKTGMLIVVIFALLTFMSNIASILILPGGSTGSLGGNIEGLAGAACSYLDSLAGPIGAPLPGNPIPTTLNYMLSLSGAVGAISSITTGAFLPIPIPIPTPEVWFEFGYTDSPYVNTMLESTPTTGSYESMLNDMFSFIVFPISLLIFAQQALLPTVVALGFVILIPLGIALRAFPFIRGIGGTLVAIGIGVAIIYPATLALLNAPVTNALAFGAYAGSGAGCSSNPAVCYLVGIISGSGTSSQGISDGISAFLPYTILPAINGMLFYSFGLILQFLLFIADIAIAYPLTDSIARTLGGTITLSLGGKLKLT